MASYIDPRCALPLYLLENENVAYNCGKLEGYVICGFITLIIIALFIFLYIKFGKKTFNYTILYIGILLLLLLIIWLAIPALSGWMNKASFRIYKAETDGFMNKGLNKEQALDKIQDLYKSKIQANAIETGSFMISSALKLSNFGANKS
jgi:hypothetical protein